VRSWDRALLPRIFGADTPDLRASMRPDRIVVDAHLPTRAPEIPGSHGCPECHSWSTRKIFIQDNQPASDRWATLPFGIARALTPEEASRPAFQSDFARRVIDYQIVRDATAIIPPYVHIDRPDSDWIDVQVGMWACTKEYLEREGIALPVTAVLAVGWRMLHPVHGIQALNPVMRALIDLAPREVALAASKSDDGAHPDERAMDLVLMIERLATDYSIILWQQGLLGEIGIAAGATGYETGIGWRERCNLPATMASRRAIQSGGRRSGRPVFVTALGRSIDRRSLEEMRQHRDIWTQPICTDTDCCPQGGRALLDDASKHAVVQRARRVDELDRIERTVWQWQNLADDAYRGLDLAARINRLAHTSGALRRIDTHALSAISAVSHLRRLDTRSSGIA
jgi:hypothetical protein